ILELKLQEMMQTEIEKNERKDENFRSHLLQAMVYEVERLIYLGALTEVSTHVAMVVLLIMERHLAKIGVKFSEPRSFIRTLLLCRINTIVRAIIYVYFLPTGVNYKKPITPESYLELDR